MQYRGTRFKTSDQAFRRRSATTFARLGAGLPSIAFLIRFPTLLAASFSGSSEKCA